MICGSIFGTLFYACIIQGLSLDYQDYNMDDESFTNHRSHTERTDCEISGTTVNCTDMSFKEIPDTFPSNVTILDLSNNNITEINTNLTNYTHLLKLYLKNNLIERFQKDCFKGLDKLIHLDLSGNRLVMNNFTFPEGVFKDLISLQKLKLNRNNQRVNGSDLLYPNRALSDLKNLTTLHLDGLTNKRFGEGFQNMTSLRNLIIIGGLKGNCQIESLHNDTFTYLPQLYMLQLKLCFINGSLINNLTFVPLKLLQILDLSNDEFIFFRYLAPALKSIDSENLTHLNIHNIMSPFTPCAKVTNEFAKSLPRSLTHIVASSNGLATIESEVFDLLPPNLTYLDLSDNRFTFGDYLKNFSEMLNLETLILDGVIGSYNLPKWYPHSENSFRDNDVADSSYSAWEAVVLSLPPNLKYVSMDTAGLAYALSEFRVNPNNTLESLILNGNKILSLTGPLTGLKRLKNLSLVDCYITYINHTFFDHFPSLEFLNLSTNSLGNKVIRKSKKEPIFRYLKNLKILDLSFTNILTINWDFFEGLDSLERLFMQRNGIYYFTVNISSLQNLKFVNLSLTELSYVLPQVRDVFDFISANHNLSIDLSENPIHCYCANLDFISWFMNALNYIQFVNIDKYKCVYEDSSEQYFNDFDYHALLRYLNRQCIPNVVLFITVSAVTFLVVCVITILILYRLRWKLRYLYYTAYLYCKSNNRNKDLNGEFEFDVFLSFADEDENFVHDTLTPELKFRGLKVHIHTLNFKAGEFITTNIVNAVHTSRKTLIVVSRNLLKSTWCRFELQMANMETVYTGRSVMIFLLVEQLSKQDVDRELLYHIQNNKYMQFPEDLKDTVAMDIFWTKLCSDLKN